MPGANFVEAPEILKEVYDMLTVAEQKLGEVTVRLEAYYTGANTSPCGYAYNEAIKCLRGTGSVAHSLAKRASDVAAHLIFKKKNPKYPKYPPYPTPTHTHAPRARLPPHLGPSLFSSTGSSPDQDLGTDTNTFPVQSLREIDLHGLRIPEAKRFINHHLNICSTQSKLTRTEIICGRGKREALKKASKKHLGKRGVKYEEVRNRGRLCVYLGDDVDNLDSDKHMREVDDEGTSTSVGNGISTTRTSTSSNKAAPQSSYTSESESRFVVSSGSSIPMSLLLSSTDETNYGTDTDSWDRE